MALVLQVVTECLVHGEHVSPDYVDDARFNPTWWHRGHAKSPVSYCRLLDGAEEVARAKVLPGSVDYSGYPTWTCPPADATEIELIEVRPDLRPSGLQYGTQAVRAIGRTYGQPVIAMSLDQTSDDFWRSLG